MRNSENQTRPTRSLLSTTETPKPNGKEHCKTIILINVREIAISLGQNGDTNFDEANSKVLEAGSNLEKIDPTTVEYSVHAATKKMQ